MDAKPPAQAPGRGITRRELEAVIRRAAELYASEADADERITEDELLRIASELGLPPRHVRQALYELPTDGAPTFLDRICGAAEVAVSRAIAAAPGTTTLTRLEEYLTTREYLQPRRRKPGRVWLAPADDTVSRLARAITRPAGRYQLARAHGIDVAVRALEPGREHIRFEVDLEPQRRRSIATAGTVSGIFGTLLGGGLAAVVGMAVGDPFGEPAGIAAAAAAFLGTAAASVSAGVAVAAARFRRRLIDTRQEVESLLDRVEFGQCLDPPPAPWRRRLGLHFFSRPPGR